MFNKFVEKDKTVFSCISILYHQHIIGVPFIGSCSVGEDRDTLIIFPMFFQTHFSSCLPCFMLEAGFYRFYPLSPLVSDWVQLIRGSKRSLEDRRKTNVFSPVLYWTTFGSWLHFSIYSHSSCQTSPSQLQLLPDST